MPYYVTRAIGTGTSKVDSFVKRGLSTSTSSTVRDADIIVIGSGNPERAITYASFSNIVQAMVTTRNVVSAVGGTTMNGSLKLYTTDGHKPPVVVVRGRTTDRETFASYGLLPTAKNDLYAGSLTFDGYKALMNAQKNAFEASPAGNTNLAGMTAWIWAIRGIKAFVEATERLASTRVYMPSALVDSLVEAGKKTYEQEKEKNENAQEKHAGWVNIIDAQMLGVYNAGLIASMDDGIMRDVANITVKQDGFLFAYFPEMLEGDPTYSFDIFMSLFAKCLSPDMESFKAIYPMIRKGFRYLAHTQAGKRLQHMFLGIEMAMSGGLVYFVKDGGEYAGFIFQPITGTVVISKNITLNATPKDELQKEVAALGAHKAAVAAIGAILRTLDNLAGNHVAFDDETARSNPRYLRNVIVTISASIIQDQIVHLEPHIRELKYQQTFWDPKDPNRIVQFIQALNSGAIWNEEPMLVTTATLTSRNAIMNYLSVFGMQAPSIYNGDTVKAIARPEADDPNLAIIGEHRVLPYIPFTIKGLIQAAGDWATVANTKTLKYTCAKKKANSGTFADRKKDDGIISEGRFEPFYQTLRQFVHLGTGGSTSEIDKKKKKRKADDGNEMDVDRAPKKAAIEYA